MNNNISNDDLFGEFISASNSSSNQTSSSMDKNNVIIDNNVLYKKLIDIEGQIQFIKTMLINQNSPSYVSPPTPLLPPKNNCSPNQQSNLQDIPKIWTSPSTSLRKYS